DAVLAADPSGRVVFLNPAASALTGWPQQQAAGQPLNAVCHIIDAAARRPIALPARARLGGRTPVGGRDGAARPGGGRAGPVRRDQGAAVGTVLVLRQANGDWLREETGRVAEQLRQRNDELAAAARRKDEFLSMLAHELRNPLAPISNGLHVLR